MPDQTPDQAEGLIQLTADVVSAYVANNSIQRTDVADFIGQVHAALKKASSDMNETPAEPLTPAIAIKRSVTPDYIICLDDGKKYKSLKRHLRTAYNMSPDEYRQKWGLHADYPMVAPNYAAARSNLAKTMGLGQKRGSKGSAPAEPAPSEPRRRSRSRKAA